MTCQIVAFQFPRSKLRLHRPQGYWDSALGVVWKSLYTEPVENVLLLFTDSVWKQTPQLMYTKQRCAPAKPSLFPDRRPRPST